MASVIELKEHYKTDQRYLETTTDESPSLLEIKNLTISSIGIKGQEEKNIVNKLNLTIKAGEMLGLVGESGSGKSLTASSIVGLLPNSLKVVDGQILFKGKDLRTISQKEMRCVRGKGAAYIFQNYQESFTPFIKVGYQLIETLRSHEKIRKQEAKDKALFWLELVDLPAKQIFGCYPHQLSGGQLQRAALAAALMLKPSLIVADEPTTALDVLTGERILDLLVDLQKEVDCAILLISHDLKHVLKRTNTVAVMYGGQIVEKGPTENIRSNPIHPYTKLLLQTRLVLSKAIPSRLDTIPGEPGLVSQKGCSFSLRCPAAFERCGATPHLRAVGHFHSTACHSIEMEGDELDATSQKCL